MPGGPGFYDYKTAAFGPAVVNPGAFGSLANIPDPTNSLGCDTFDAASVAAVMGKIAIIDRGTCSFVVKVKNAQNAGAFGVLIANNAAGSAPGLGGSDPTITIPTVSVSQSDGAKLHQAVIDAVKYGGRGRPGSVLAAFAKDTSRKAGADSLGRRSTGQPAGQRLVGVALGPSAFPNLLVEPNIHPDLTTTLVPPLDRTFPLQDIGW